MTSPPARMSVGRMTELQIMSALPQTPISTVGTAITRAPSSHAQDGQHPAGLLALAKGRGDANQAQGHGQGQLGQPAPVALHRHRVPVGQGEGPALRLTVGVGGHHAHHQGQYDEQSGSQLHGNALRIELFWEPMLLSLPRAPDELPCSPGILRWIARSRRRLPASGPSPQRPAVREHSRFPADSRETGSWAAPRQVSSSNCHRRRRSGSSRRSRACRPG